VEKTPSKKAIYAVLSIFFVGGLGFLIGAGFSWADEHGGTPGKAHVTHCTSHDFGKRAGSSIDCDATWTYKGRTVTGYVENAMANQVGKTISVRIHGTSHVTNTTYWVPIGLAIFGVLEFAVGAMVLRRIRRRAQPT
jgi:hypothetical protein